MRYGAGPGTRRPPTRGSTGRARRGGRGRGQHYPLVSITISLVLLLLFFFSSCIHHKLTFGLTAMGARFSEVCECGGKSCCFRRRTVQGTPTVMAASISRRALQVKCVLRVYSIAGEGIGHPLPSLPSILILDFWPPCPNLSFALVRGKSSGRFTTLGVRPCVDKTGEEEAHEVGS